MHIFLCGGRIFKTLCGVVAEGGGLLETLCGGVFCSEGVLEVVLVGGLGEGQLEEEVLVLALEVGPAVDLLPPVGVLVRALQGHAELVRLRQRVHRLVVLLLLRKTRVQKGLLMGRQISRGEVLFL